MRAVLERDYVAEASRFRAFALRTLVGIVVTTIVYTLLYDRRMELEEAPDIVARSVFGIAGSALVVALALITPAAVVGAVLDERTRETLSLVLAAPVGPASFASAKFLARTTAVLTLGAAALVPLFLTTLLGGIGGEEVVDFLVLCLAVAIELAAWGLWISTVARNLSTASVLAYLLPLVRWVVTAGLLVASLVWWLFPGGPAAISPDLWGSYGTRALLHVATLTTPIPAFVQLASPDTYDYRVRSIVAETTGDRMPRGARDSVVVSRGSGVYTWKRIRVGAFSKGANSFRFVPVRVFIPTPTPPSPPPLPFPWKRPAPLYLAFALGTALLSLHLSSRRLAREAEPPGNGLMRFLRRKRQIGSPPDRGNPVAWKEERLLNAAASRPLYYTALAVFVAAELLLLFSSGLVLDRGQVLRLGLCLATGHVLLLSLAAVVAGAASMAHERAFGTLDLLRASPLTAAEVLDGKVRGLLRGLGLVGLVPVLHLVLLGCGGHLDPISAIAGIVIEAILVLAWCGVGVYCGIGAAGMGIAVRRGVLAFTLAVLGLPLVGFAFGRLLGIPALGDALASASPPVQFYALLDGLVRTFNQTWLQAFSWQVFLPFNFLGGETLPDRLVPWCAAWLGLTILWLWLGRRHATRLLARRFESSREDG